MKRNPKHSDKPRLVLYDERQFELAKAAARAHTLISVNRGLWHRLKNHDIDCVWAFGDDSFVSIEAREAATEALLSESFTSFGHELTDSLDVWRRTNKFYFRYLAGHYLSAKLVSPISDKRKLFRRNQQTLIPIRPDQMEVFGLFFGDDCFPLFLKGLNPDAIFVDETDLQPVAPDRKLRLTVRNDFDFRPATHRQLSPVDTLVMPAAMNDDASNFVSETNTVLLVGSAFDDREVVFGVDNRPDHWFLRQNRLGPELLATCEGWLRALWLPRLQSLKSSVQHIVGQSKPRQVAVANHLFPESALLLEAAAGSEVSLIIASHGLCPMDLELWTDLPPAVTALTAMRSGVKWWASVGLKGTQHENSYLHLAKGLAAAKPPGNGGTDKLKVLYAGGLSCEVTYPVLPAGPYSNALARILQIPDTLESKIDLTAKFRPTWESAAWYDEWKIDLLSSELGMMSLLKDFDIAVFLEFPSTGCYEAIANGCAVLCVSDDPQSFRWSGQGGYSQNPFPPSQIPVIEPAHYWETVAVLEKNRSELVQLWRTQADWLRTELSRPES